jgi:dCTP deaminase
MVNKVWGEVCHAELHRDWCKRNGAPLENIGLDERIIWLKPGETILGHTNEFIGGRRSVTTMMKARSSLGRNFIEVCKCAGWGDVGYVNRWTMEITNNSRYYSIPLVVGRRVAQIVFFDTEGIESLSYEKSGKYQTRYVVR